ncbi:hypothetical protein KBD49_06485 [Myxococcota bacterium]|jgi:uncharacterized membrane protein YhaH (DUF805 family)|nr:hypothetical protein [Myxococcota bacterium]
MDGFLSFLSGPVFRFCLAVAILGVLSQFLQNAMILVAADPRKPFRALGQGLRRWLDPVTRAGRNPWWVEVLVWASLAGVVVVPLFYLGHARLWGRSLGLLWPSVPAAWTDLLTRITMVTLGALLVARLLDRSVRRSWSLVDWAPLVLAWTAFVTGYLVAHPGRSPLAPDTTALLHFLSADLLLVLLPFTRVSRCVLMPPPCPGTAPRTQEVTR